VNGSFYYTKAQVIGVKKDNSWQENSIVYDVLSDGDKLYIIGLVQMYPPSGAFIAKVDPYLNADISYLLERADVVYLEDIPPCKS
jgi:exonuclease VII large subunit